MPAAGTSGAPARISRFSPDRFISRTDRKAMAEPSVIPTILAEDETALLEEWIGEQTAGVTTRRDLLSEVELRQQSAEFLTLARAAAAQGRLDDPSGASWEPVRDLLDRLSRARAMQGFSPSETAMFVFSLKRPLFA